MFILCSCFLLKENNPKLFLKISFGVDFFLLIGLYIFLIINLEIKC
jgi:hypothetical protein